MDVEQPFTVMIHERFGKYTHETSEDDQVRYMAIDCRLQRGIKRLPRRVILARHNLGDDTVVPPQMPTRPHRYDC